MSNKILILGLGNPEDQYANTRHNAGKSFVNLLAENWAFEAWHNKAKLKAELCQGQFAGREILLAKSSTFMNVSGQAAKLLLNYFDIKLADFWLVHDDSDLELGKYKFVFAASSAGHHGAQAVIDELGSNEFNRLRLGIRGKADQRQAGEFVLTAFSATEQDQFKTALQQAAQELEQKLTLATKDSQ